MFDHAMPTADSDAGVELVEPAERRMERPTGRRAADKALRPLSPEGAALPCLLGAVEGLSQGLALLRAPDQVVYVNPAARRALTDSGWCIEAGVLTAPHHAQLQDWHRLVHNAGERQYRGIFDLLPGKGGPMVSVTPMPVGEQVLALLTFGRTQVCGPLELQLFASRHGLSPAETQVLLQLCKGNRPAAIAQLHGVAVSTVVTQICAIRFKTESASIEHLLQRLACLPPLRSALSEACIF
jgi:DNA-binding CsgD family transcriptional regulator